MEQERLRPVPLALLVRLGVFWFAISFNWGALLTVVVPAEVLRFVPETQKGLYLGLLFAGGAVVAMVISPLAGALSDRSTLPMGRRRPFVVGGVLLAVPGLLGLRYAPTYAAFAAALLWVQLTVNLAASAFNGLIPDKIPRTQRGAMSGVMGGMMMGGTIAAALLSGRLVGQGMTAAVYWVIAGVLLAATAIIVWKVGETPLREAPPLVLPAFIRSFWVDPRRYPDFAWLFATRGLVMLGFYTIITFLQFFLRDTLHLSRPDAAQATGTISAVVIAAGALVALVAGPASDLIGRKGIVSTAGMFLAFTGIGLLFQPPFHTLLWIGVLFGIGYGAYASVDWALAIDVLPSGQSAAKDLGIWGIANTLPQVLAPVIAGPLLDVFNRMGPNRGYSVIFSMAIVEVVLGSIFIWKIKGTR
ncbi:MAG TPA: MFS transporter [bacterium]|nr:MFS transporter [bacterium]